METMQAESNDEIRSRINEGLGTFESLGNLSYQEDLNINAEMDFNWDF